MKPLRFNEKDFDKLLASLRAAKDESQFYKLIVNSPFKRKDKVVLLGLGAMVFLLVNKKDGTLDRIALSDTEPAQGAVEYSVKPFHEIRIPLDADENILIKAIKTGKPQQTDDWQHMFVPELTPEEARFNQAGAGIGCSCVYPIKVGDGGALIYSYFIPLTDINSSHHDFMSRYASFVESLLADSPTDDLLPK